MKILKWVGGIVVLVMVVAVVAWGLTADDSTALTEHQRQAQEDAANATICHKANGIVIRSAWDNRIIDCKVVR